ncbi:hypothetical protein TrVFT333_004296 [Trichoderma virens FT-333]|nr:hypothetical protein TrVFT333_004296 [Trichoderma virens FT-333]
MPLINGQKMACEPCIRGHRSTKCTHASERLMVPVRKPGRPLSSCPHPSSQHCGCAAVTAAIPKKQKCRCGTSEKASGRKAGDQESQDTSNGLVTPPSPSPKGAATKPAYRVQKTGSKSASGRKPIDPADLERIDASQVNILSSPESKSPQSPNGAMPTIPTGHGMMGFLPNGTFIPGPAIFPSYQEVASGNPIIDHAAPELTASNGHTPPRMDKMLPLRPEAAVGMESRRPPKQMNSRQLYQMENPSQVNGLVMPPFNVPIGMPNGMFPYFVQPTIFAYPPQYGSYLQPLQPDQYRQLVTLNFPQQMANMQTMPYNAATPVQFPQPDDLEADSWTSHQCACGDSCQCIGCATHPYNQATQDYVRSAWNSMSEDTHKRHKHSDSVQSIPNGNYEEATPANQSPNGASTPVMAKVEGAVSPTLAQTPSDANSSLGEEPTLSANDFFFVSYPFGDSCEGEMASCPCGDSCQCIGCAIHNSSASADFDNVELGL